LLKKFFIFIFICFLYFFFKIREAFKQELCIINKTDLTLKNIQLKYYLNGQSFSIPQKDLRPKRKTCTPMITQNVEGGLAIQLETENNKLYEQEIAYIFSGVFSTKVEIQADSTNTAHLHFKVTQAFPFSLAYYFSWW
jgi:hypothetical protein